MKKLLLLFVSLCTITSISAQCDLPGQWTGNTGANMTVMLTGMALNSIEVTDENAYFVALGENGDLFGSGNPADTQNGNLAISLWGDDASTPEIDGAATGEEVSLFLVDGDALYSLGISVSYITLGTEVIMSATQEFVCGDVSVPGCTNAGADNFNSEATDDDGSCVITGCMDASADNYDASANNAGACDYSGCTNADACNYDAGANVEDGSCTYAASGYDCAGVCLDDADGDGTCDAFEVLGCIDPLGCNFNPDATDSGFCTYPSQTYLDCNGECNFDDDGDGICDENESEGCTNSAAFNYNENATDDDGSCEAVKLGCMDESASNYDDSANTDNGLCQYPGCTDPLAFNFDPSANLNDGSCFDVVLGCMDQTALNYLITANTDDDSCIDVVPGCMNGLAINFNANANVDDESCIMPAAGFDVMNSNTGNNATIFIDANAFAFSQGDNLGAFFVDENGDHQCAGVLSWNTDEGNLIVVNGDDPNTLAIDGAHGEIIWKTNVDGQAVVLFATYGPYGPEMILGNNEYAANAAYLITGFDIAVEGCMDTGYMEYNADANVDDGTCDVLFSQGYVDALSDIDGLNDDIEDLEQQLFDDNSTSAAAILALQTELSTTIADYDSQLSDLENMWQEIYNQDMNDLDNYMQGIIDNMQAACDDQVAGLENDLAVLNQGLLDSISSYEGQLSDMQAAWDVDAADYQGQLVAMQAAWDADAADYQNQLSTLVDNHTAVVADLNGQITAWTNSYNAEVADHAQTVIDMQSAWDDEVAAMQAAWDAQVTQLTDDASDAADAAALFLANTIQSYDNEIATINFAYTSEIAGINADHNSAIEQIAYLDGLEDAAYQADIVGLNSDIVELNSDIDGLNSDIDGLNDNIAGLNNDLANLTTLQGETSDALDYYSAPIVFDLNQGWNMIGFSHHTTQDVAATLQELGNSLHLIKNNNAAVYWPEFGFNSLQDVVPGQGYQVRMYYSVDDFSFPELGEDVRLEVTPQVPDWVHDMVIPNHPNDTRSLVRVVNMLGQEVNPEDVFKGEVLLYLYSDGSVEKTIK